MQIQRDSASALRHAAIQNGRLYIWAADGQSPDGKVWAPPNANGVNADQSSDITIDGVKIFSGTDGISANMSTNLQLLNTDICESARDGIWASGSKEMDAAIPGY